MAAHVTFLLALFAQVVPTHPGKHRLSWSLQAGDALTFEWMLKYSSQASAPEEDAELETKVRARGTVKSVSIANDMRLELAIEHYSTEGKVKGKAVAMKYEGGKVLALSEGLKEAVEKRMKEPLDLVLSRKGEVRTRWGEDSNPEAIGFLGGRLPAFGVEVGESWEDEVRLFGETDAGRALAIRPRLREWTDERAKIEAVLEKELDLSPRKPVARVHRETQFDVQRGRVALATLDISLAFPPVLRKARGETLSWALSVKITAR